MSRKQPATILAEQIDDHLAQAGDIAVLQFYKGSWIQNTRLALGWVLNDLGGKLNMSKQALLQLEKRELEGTISIRKLEEVAGAMPRPA